MWECRFSAEKALYYYHNTVSDESVWSRPVDYNSNPEDFLEKTDELSGRAYYYDRTTGESVWDRPTCLDVVDIDEDIDDEELGGAGNLADPKQLGLPAGLAASSLLSGTANSDPIRSRARTTSSLVVTYHTSESEALGDLSSSSPPQPQNKLKKTKRQFHKLNDT